MRLHEMPKSLDSTTVFFVGEDDANRAQIFQYFLQCGVKYEAFNNQDELKYRIEKSQLDLEGQTFYCCIHEDLYEEKAYTTFLKPSIAVLLTYGPNYNVHSSYAHFRSLGQLLPSVLMSCITSALVENSRAYYCREKVMRNMSLSSARYLDYKVLIAEDNRINQKVLIRILERIGVNNVDVVANGLEAVRKEASTRYDVVLMDMQMPILDGVEACRQIMARQGGHRHPSIVFVTAHVSNAYELQCMQAGGSGFLSKPFNIRDLEKTLQEVYNSKIARETLSIEKDTLAR